MKVYPCKIVRITLLLVSAGLVLGATSLIAGEVSPGLKSGPYVGMDIGVNLASDLTVPSETSISLSPGVRWGVSAGYAFKLDDHLTVGPELEIGLMFNPLDNSSSGGGSASVDGYFSQVPMMANGVLHWQVSSNWVAYAGGGVGYNYSYLDITSVDGVDVNSTGSETDFAWQGMAGLRYKFGAIEFGLGYKYLGFTPSGMETVNDNAILLTYRIRF
jgi:opacity protein-like surface antigen